MLLAAEITALVVLSGVTGAALTQHFVPGKAHHPVNTSLFLAAVPVPPQQVRDDDSILATQEERIIQLKEENQASKDDRRLLHEDVAKIANLETAHDNALNDRLNVDEARLSTVMWVVGFIFTLTKGIVVFFHIADRMKQPRDGREGMEMKRSTT
jgi:hypothetical protein